jgi:hypothetical protein
MLQELIYSWYAEHNITKPPTIDRVSSTDLALQRFKDNNDYDMVVTLMYASALRLTVPTKTKMYVPSRPVWATVRSVAATFLFPRYRRMDGTSAFCSAVHQMKPSMPIAMLALNRTELTSLDPRVDQSSRVNVNKRLTWETAKAGGAVGSDPSDAWIWPFLWQGSPSIFTAMVLFSAQPKLLQLPVPPQ